MKPILRPALLAATLPLTGCLAPALPPEPPPPITAQHQIEIERAYKLEDPREDDFKARIADQAMALCASKRHLVLQMIPIGFERYGEDYITRDYRILIACQG